MSKPRRTIVRSFDCPVSLPSPPHVSRSNFCRLADCACVMLPICAQHTYMMQTSDADSPWRYTAQQAPVGREQVPICFLNCRSWQPHEQRHWHGFSRFLCGQSAIEAYSRNARTNINTPQRKTVLRHGRAKRDGEPRQATTVFGTVRVRVRVWVGVSVKLQALTSCASAARKRYC